MRYIWKIIDFDTQNSILSSRNYNCDEAKAFLAYTYEYSCAYCEGRPEPTSFSQIEHFYEKSVYPQFKFDLRNLHYSCQDCNASKQHQKNKYRPILSPNYYLEINGSEDKCDKTCSINCKFKERTGTEKSQKQSSLDKFICEASWKEVDRIFISQQLKYSGHLLFPKEKGSIADNTIRCFDLNNEEKRGRIARGSLVDDRLRIYCMFAKRVEIIFNCIKEIRIDPYSQSSLCLWMVVKNEMSQINRDLKGRYQLPYTQMLLDNFTIPIIQLLKIIRKTKEEQNLSVSN